MIVSKKKKKNDGDPISRKNPKPGKRFFGDCLIHTGRDHIGGTGMGLADRCKPS